MSDFEKLVHGLAGQAREDALLNYIKKLEAELKEWETGAITRSWREEWDDKQHATKEWEAQQIAEFADTEFDVGN